MSLRTHLFGSTKWGAALERGQNEEEALWSGATGPGDALGLSETQSIICEMRAFRLTSQTLGALNSEGGSKVLFKL